MDSRIRVLIADDHRLFAQSLTLMLEAGGDIDVIGYAADGREAVALAAVLQPDVVVMDLDMPLVDGVEATRGVRRATPDARVVLVAGARDPHDANRARHAGASAYIPKAASVDQLR